jgi:hypothetical protein
MERAVLKSQKLSKKRETSRIEVAGDCQAKSDLPSRRRDFDGNGGEDAAKIDRVTAHPTESEAMASSGAWSEEHPILAEDIQRRSG